MKKKNLNLSKTDLEIFWEKITNPKYPNENLIQAVRKYKSNYIKQ